MTWDSIRLRYKKIVILRALTLAKGALFVYNKR